VKLDSLIAELEALKAMYGPDVEVAFKAASETQSTPITSAAFSFEEATRDWVISLMSLPSDSQEESPDEDWNWEENDYESRMEGWMDSRGEE
jgi:hypothetical protein